MWRPFWYASPEPEPEPEPEPRSQAAVEAEIDAWARGEETAPEPGD
jgi:hypothetical protein